MHHPNQSNICSDCKVTFRSHRALKNHQQRFHVVHSENLPNYSYISSSLVVAFSTEQFQLIAANACEQERFPLGEWTSKLFQCQYCQLSLPSSNALKFHLLRAHEQYEYHLCRNLLHAIIVQVEENLRTVSSDDDEIESMKLLLAKRAAHLGLVDKQLARECRTMKAKHHRRIFPSCEHRNRTCANLCLEYLSPYQKLIRNYSYKIPTVPKGNPFAQGSIVSKLANGSSLHTSIISKESLNTKLKRPTVKRLSLPNSPKQTLPKANFSYSNLLCTQFLLKLKFFLV